MIDRYPKQSKLELGITLSGHFACKLKFKNLTYKLVFPASILSLSKIKTYK